MTKLINKGDENINLYFTLDRQTSRFILLELINDFDLNSIKIPLPAPAIANERYTLFTVTNDDFKNLNDGLYTYHLGDSNGSLESGSMKIQYNNYGSIDPSFIEFEEDGDDFITCED